MTTNRSNASDDDRPRPQIDPLRPDRLQCPCGATAERDGLCRKCRARALWGRRNTGRRACADRPLTRGAGSASRGPRGRRCGR